MSNCPFDVGDRVECNYTDYHGCFLQVGTVVCNDYLYHSMVVSFDDMELCRKHYGTPNHGLGFNFGRDYHYFELVGAYIPAGAVDNWTAFEKAAGALA